MPAIFFFLFRSSADTLLGRIRRRERSEGEPRGWKEEGGGEGGGCSASPPQRDHVTPKCRRIGRINDAPAVSRGENEKKPRMRRSRGTHSARKRTEEKRESERQKAVKKKGKKTASPPHLRYPPVRRVPSFSSFISRAPLFSL